MSLNKVFVLGNLGKDPEIKYTANSMAVCNFSVATTESWKNKKGEPQEHVEWFNIEVWGKVAENCSKYLSKGSQVFIEGSLRTDEYEKDGEKRFFTKLVARNVQFLNSGEKKKSSANDSFANQQFNVKTDPAYTVDEIPF